MGRDALARHLKFNRAIHERNNRMEVDISAPEPVKKVILATGAVDGESLKVSKIQNEKRAESRKKIKEAGMNTAAYGMGVKVAKMMLNQGERDDFIRDFLVTVDTLTKVQMEIFPELAMIADRKRAKAAERAAKKAAAEGKETPEQQERRLAADSNPRNSPDAGGAGKKRRGKKADAVERAMATSAERNGELAGGAVNEPGTDGEDGDALIKRVAAEKQAEQEQRDGAALLDGAGKPKSQTEIAQQKRDEAGVP
jgi:hypothetical protein